MSIINQHSSILTTPSTANVREMALAVGTNDLVVGFESKKDSAIKELFPKMIFPTNVSDFRELAVRVFRIFNTMCATRSNWSNRARDIKERMLPHLPTGDPQLPDRFAVEEFMRRFEGDHQYLAENVLPSGSNFFTEKFVSPEAEARPQIEESDVEILVEKAMVDD